jgi:GNAT superfamily N-acetyltransferase
MTAPRSRLITLALDVDAAALTLGSETFQAAHATFARNRDAPLIYDANHVFAVTASTQAEMDELLARAGEEYSGFGHRRFDVDFRAHPGVAARLALEGYERSEGLVMLLEGELRARPRHYDIRPVTGDAAWADFAALKLSDWNERQQRRGYPAEPGVAGQMVALARAKHPRVQYFIAYAESRPAAFFSSFPGFEGVGQVEDLFTLPEFRRRGLATALIARCVADCRRRGAKHVVIIAGPADTPKQMYAAMGFEPVALQAQYFKRVAAAV